ncbi:MAG: antitoxin [Acidobacteria bacterium]|nr:antitoxin [Acidobacteriota bacterium]
MRTTLTLDRDVAETLKKEMRRTGRGLKAVINDALRRGLRIGGKPPRSPRFAVQPHAFGVKPGVDPDRMNQLVDELEAEERARTLRP